MTTKITITKKEKPDFEVNFYGKDLTFKNVLTLPASLIEKSSKTPGINPVLEQLRAGARDVEALNASLEEAEQGDVIELYKVWNAASKDIVEND